MINLRSEKNKESGFNLLIPSVLKLLFNIIFVHYYALSYHYTFYLSRYYVSIVKKGANGHTIDSFIFIYVKPLLTQPMLR